MPSTDENLLQRSCPRQTTRVRNDLASTAALTLIACGAFAVFVFLVYDFANNWTGTIDGTHLVFVSTRLLGGTFTFSFFVVALFTLGPRGSFRLNSWVAVSAGWVAAVATPAWFVVAAGRFHPMLGFRTSVLGSLDVWGTGLLLIGSCLLLSRLASTAWSRRRLAGRARFTSTTLARVGMGTALMILLIGSHSFAFNHNIFVAWSYIEVAPGPYGAVGWILALVVLIGVAYSTVLPATRLDLILVWASSWILAGVSLVLLNVPVLLVGHWTGELDLLSSGAGGHILRGTTYSTLVGVPLLFFSSQLLWWRLAPG